MEYHDIVNIFPQMNYDELQALAEDIKANGQLEPILLFNGKIADGRNRFMACELAEVEPDFVDWLGSEENLISHVVSLNVKRRHLNQSQIAAIAIEIKKMYEAVAKDRQGRRTDLLQKSQNISELSSQKLDSELGRSSDLAGKDMGVSGRYIDIAESVKEKAPDLFDEVRKGNISLRQADTEVKRREIGRTESLVEGKFDIIYARPPLGIFPDELIEMGRGIKSICNEDCLLVMCCPSSSLENIFLVTKSWGFKYRACFIWDKMQTKQGRYNQVKHEFILLCGKGDIAPNDPTMFYSIIPLEEDENGADAFFLRMIQQMYPGKSIIRLFQGGVLISNLKA